MAASRLIVITTTVLIITGITAQQHNTLLKHDNVDNMAARASAAETNDKMRTAELQERIDELEARDATMMKQIDALIRQVAAITTASAASGAATGPKLQSQSATATVNSVITTGGVHYIRWGSNDCPSGSEPLYHGYAAGNHYTHNWGGANTLCLHDRPQWSQYATPQHYIYGAEYGFSSAPFSTANNAGHSLQHHDVPCVACHSAIRSSHIMIPGRTQCPVGWNHEYKGYIVSTLVHGHAVKGDYICLEQTPDVRVGGSGHTNGLQLQHVSIHCGSLPCPRYTQGMPLTCVVCTK